MISFTGQVSDLVNVYAAEPNSDVVRAYFESRATK